MTTFRKIAEGEAFDPESGNIVYAAGSLLVLAWIDSLPPLEPVELSAQRERMPAGLVRRAQVWASWFASNGAETHPEDSSSIVCDLAACEPAATLPPLESEPASSTGLDALHECRDVLGAKSAESCIDAARRVVAESKAKDEQIAVLRRMPAGLIARAKAYLPSEHESLLRAHFREASAILRDLAACEPAAMLTVDEAVRVVHDVKRVIVRGTPIPNTVDTFDVEEALRKAVKS